MTLNITNGDVIGGRLQAIDIDGNIMPWREVLHEGPLLDYQSVDVAGRNAFNQNRATFIASRGWGRIEDVLDDMNQRDEVLLDMPWKEIVLWMEPDLFDQLILAQVLTLLHRSGKHSRVDCRLVQTSSNLNYHTDSELIAISRTPRTLSAHAIAPYLQFWLDVTHARALTHSSDDPEPLRIAKRQWMDLQPSDDGFSAFDHRVLEVVRNHGSVRVDVLFQMINAEEGPYAYWGDTAFFSRLQDLAQRQTSLQVSDNVVVYAG